jgi:hypothetical protein
VILSLRRYVSERLFGISIPQEYVCLGVETFQQKFSAFVTGIDGFFSSIINKDLFLGYRPLILGLTFARHSDEAKWMRRQDDICITYVRNEFHPDRKWNGFVSDKSAVARLILRKIEVRNLGETDIFLFCGKYGEHSFLTSFHQTTNRIRVKSRLNKPDNYLPGNLYDQVRIAYSIPRIISIITLQDAKGLMNMFPTDLHGKVGSSFYVGSLRKNGKASQQVELIQSIVLSNVSAEWYSTAYALGKNHMGDLREDRNFPLSDVRSQRFSIPLPESALNYHELRRIDSMDIGIHRIHFYEILHKQGIRDGVTLAHIHQFCAQWRENHHLSSEYFLR